MRTFSIQDLVNYTSLKAHTIRVWEHRFSLMNPGRSVTNFRRYNLQEVAYLLNISLLNKAGYKISRLAVMSGEQIEESISRLKDMDHNYGRELNKLIIKYFSNDLDGFDSNLDSCLLTFGLDGTIKHIILPFLERIQIFSCKNCETEVDFVMNSLRRKLILGIEKANPEFNQDKTALLFLPDGEHFDLLLLYFNYILKCLGYKTLYMGTNISIEKIKTVNISRQPDFTLTYISPDNSRGLSEITQYIKEKPSGNLMVVSFTNNDHIRKDQLKLNMIDYTNASHAISKIAYAGV